MSRTLRYEAEQRPNIATRQIDTLTPLDLFKEDVMLWVQSNSERSMLCEFVAAPNQIGSVSVSIRNGFMTIRKWQVNEYPFFFGKVDECSPEQLQEALEEMYSSLEFTD